MNPGRLRERVTHLVPATITTDQYGRATGSEYTPDETIRADVDEQTRGRENIRAGQDEGMQRVFLTIRTKSNVTTASRFTYRGRTLRVINVGVPDSMRRLQVIECAYAGD